MRISGVWHDDKRFGPQVKVRSPSPIPPSGDEALLAYLKRVRHVGRGARLEAARALRRATCSRSIDEDPGLAFRRDRPEPAARQGGRRSPGTRCAPPAPCTCCSRRTGSRGSSRGSPTEYGDRAHDMVRKRPYELTSVFGVGFAIADTIARAAGVPRDSPGRRRAAVVHVLIEAEREGSTCLPVPELATQGRAAARRPAARRAAACRTWPSTASWSSRRDGAVDLGVPPRDRRARRRSSPARSANSPPRRRT